jgi:hypothetical protein
MPPALTHLAVHEKDIEASLASARVLARLFAAMVRRSEHDGSRIPRAQRSSLHQVPDRMLDASQMCKVPLPARLAGASLFDRATVSIDDLAF